MKRAQILALGLAGGLFFTPALHAVAPGENPYAGIVGRNPFALVPLPPPAAPVTNTPPSNIKLTGINNFFGKKQALMLVQETGPGNKPEKSCILAEGQRDADLEVVAIDDQAGSVTVNNAGEVQTLTFDKDGVKAAPTAPVAAPGQPGIGMMPPSHAILPPGGFNIPRPGGGFVNGNVPGYNPGQPANPARDIRTLGNSSSAPATPISQQPALSPEVQTIAIEVERQRLTQAGDETAKLLPPTELSLAPPGP